MRRFGKFIVLSSLLFIACGLKRPDVEDCVLNGSLQLGHCITKDDKEIDRSIPEMHKYICHPLEDNAALELYISQLEEKAARCR